MAKTFRHTQETADSVGTDFDAYLNNIIHSWSETLAALAFSLIPTFFILDYFIMPKELLAQFGIYRLISTVVFLIQFFVIRRTRPSKWSYIHGYLSSINAGGFIALMTVDLGGFDSSYYAGLNLVLIGVNLLLPWPALHSIINSALVVAMYVTFNLISGSAYNTVTLINNLFFLLATGIVAVSINHVKHRLVKKEFNLLVELKKARDALWAEMELAKRIQTALLPNKKDMSGFEVAATMLPAKEVGGDYYEIMETGTGERWIAIGDVSGHGVDSGLVMMMAQTSMASMVLNQEGLRPSALLGSVNSVMRQNISRLGSDHYMTMTAIRLNGHGMMVSGKHQDLIVYRSGSNRTEVVNLPGTWLGIADDIEGHLKDVDITLETGDLVLLFTDGVTEATNGEGEMFGQERLSEALDQFADLPVAKIIDNIVDEVGSFQSDQLDDITLIVLKKTNNQG